MLFVCFWSAHFTGLIVPLKRSVVVLNSFVFSFVLDACIRVNVKCSIAFFVHYTTL